MLPIRKKKLKGKRNTRNNPHATHAISLRNKYLFIWSNIRAPRGHKNKNKTHKTYHSTSKLYIHQLWGDSSGPLYSLLIINKYCIVHSYQHGAVCKKAFYLFTTLCRNPMPKEHKINVYEDFFFQTSSLVSFIVFLTSRGDLLTLTFGVFG